MNVLTFRDEIIFEVRQVAEYPKITHLCGHFRVGKFEAERRVRVEPDDRWTTVRRIKLPGKCLQEMRGQYHNRTPFGYEPGRYDGKLYIFPDGEATSFSFNQVEVLETK